MRSTRKVIFPKQHGVVKARPQRSPRATDHLPSAKASTMVGAGAELYAIPLTFSTPPLIKDSLVTATSSAQDENVQETLPWLTATADSTRHPFEYNEYGVPRLDRLQHIEFLKNGLEEFPASFVSLDASRPWMVYWALNGLYLLGEDVTQYRTRLVPLAFYCGVT
jgi:protein farnesyltransferase subunit beta